eukprot:2706040-Prymnesium_polylepis.1
MATLAKGVLPDAGTGGGSRGVGYVAPAHEVAWRVRVCGSSTRRTRATSTSGSRSPTLRGTGCARGGSVSGSSARHSVCSRRACAPTSRSRRRRSSCCRREKDHTPTHHTPTHTPQPSTLMPLACSPVGPLK